ncbi:MAG TPA: GNAT family N-acetyltransferase [Kribbella sp.]|nr:GNAT family N-acetyltransferase [Kribbella sp.]
MRFPEDVPVLTDGVVTLRAHTTDDIPAALAMCQDPEMQRWTTVPVPYERQHAEHFLTEHIPAGWRDGGFWGWAIEHDGRFAGSIDLRDGEGNAGEIGFGLGPWARGAGVMTRAVRLVVAHAFDGFGWDRVTWRALVGNWGSRRVAWKNGFRHLVQVPGGGLARGVRRDEWVASIARDDDRQPQGHWWEVPVIEGDGLRLRPFRVTDAKRVTEACGDERTQHWLAGLPSPYLLEHAEGFIESRQENAASGEGVSWVVADPDTDELLANVSIFDLANRIDPTSGEVGYWSHPEARGRGVMTAAVGLAVKHAFRPVEEGGLGRRRLTLFAAEGNTASAHVALANGFVPTGAERAANPRRDGGYDNLLGFDLLVTD